MTGGETTEVDLLGFATDSDSPDAEINYQVSGVSLPGGGGVAEIAGRVLRVSPEHSPVEQAEDASAENGWIDLIADSQGKTAATRLYVRYSAASLDMAGEGLRLAAASVRDGQLTLRGEKAMTAVVYTPEGRMVMEVAAPAGESIHSLGQLSAGLYILRFGGKTLKFRI